jgi:hypothetical protein
MLIYDDDCDNECGCDDDKDGNDDNDDGNVDGGYDAVVMLISHTNAHTQYWEQRHSYDERKEYVGREVHKPTHVCHYHGHSGGGKGREGGAKGGGRGAKGGVVAVSNCNSHGFQGLHQTEEGEWFGFEAAHKHLSELSLNHHRRRLQVQTPDNSKLCSHKAYLWSLVSLGIRISLRLLVILRTLP